MSIPTRAQNKGLHPLLASIADRIRLLRSELSELEILHVNPELINICKKNSDLDISIINELYRSKGIRKHHLEIAEIKPGLQILHCVLFPDPIFDIPIFGVDVVSIHQCITAAIVDISPVGNELQSQILEDLQKLDLPSFSNVRRLPEWGEIFSDCVCFIKPENEEEENKFSDIVFSYLNIYQKNIKTQKPELSSSFSVRERKDSQIKYCYYQKKNDKTRNVLSKAFGTIWANNYIDLLLFNEP